MEEFICDDDFNIFPNQMEVEYDFDINLISNLQEINQIYHITVDSVAPTEAFRYSNVQVFFNPKIIPLLNLI